MNIDFANKTVFVSGASKGIGLACAAAFVAANAKVVMVSRNRDNLQAAAAELQKSPTPPTIIAADLTVAADAERAVAEAERAAGPIDVLINSAGAAKRYIPAQLSAQSWDEAMRAKFFSYIYPTDAVLRRMVPRKRGAIVNIIGMGGKVASPTHLPGGAANAALMLATVGLASAYAGNGIRINGINPGPVLTGRVAMALEAESAVAKISKDEMLAQMQAKIPLGRMAAPEEVAAVAMFLASDAASYVTGALIPMDGGASAAV